MGLLEHLGIPERAAALPRARCSRCGHTHVESLLATVQGPYGPELACLQGCPEPIGVHPALARANGQRWWEWEGSCLDVQA